MNRALMGWIVLGLLAPALTPPASASLSPDVARRHQEQDRRVGAAHLLPIVLQAAEVGRGLENNALAVEAIVCGKILRMNGIIRSLDRDRDGVACVTLIGSEDGLHDVACYFCPQREASLLRLHAGDRIALKGISGRVARNGDLPLMGCRRR
jgi:hypothetical protein